MVGSAPNSLVERAAILSNAGFLHGFSTRAGGADFSLLRAPDALALDCTRLAREVGFDPARLYQAKQVHGTTAHIAVGNPADVVTRDGDAVVARDLGAAAGIRVADCVPVLVADEATGTCAAIHAGWRGVERGIVRAVVLAYFLDGGSSKIIAAIGPSIGHCCFEVSLDVATQIEAAVADPRVVVARYPERKAKVDLRLAVRAQLVACGLADDRIEDVGGCSFCDPEKYHSFRRDGDASGRMIAVIVAPRAP